MAERRFAVGAVNIDVAVVGVDFAAAVNAGFEAAEPEDAGGDEVASVGFGRELAEMVAGTDAGFEDHARGLADADAFGDFVVTARSAE